MSETQSSTAGVIESASLKDREAVNGLTTEEARRRLAQFGPNDPSPSKRRSFLRQIADRIANPLVLILLIAAGVAAALGQKADATIITVVVILGAAIDFLQTYRSEHAVKMLRDRVAPTATVLRDGSWVEIQRREIVPGDAVRLSSGDLVPADARVAEARDLFVQQSALTGESFPVEKEAAADDPNKYRDASAPNMVFLGTSVVSGTATAIVVATGRATTFGDIAARLAERPEETEFEHGLRRFGGLILRVVFFLVLFILAMSLALKHDPVESLLFAMALAVGLTPEFLPMITSVILANGAVQMSKQKVIVKHLAAIQNFGSIDVFCSDKTGTLTAGKMKLERSCDPLGNASRAPTVLAYVNSKFETGIRSPLDEEILAQKSLTVDGYKKIDEIPFDFERRRVSVVAERATGGTTERLLIAKGAPEGMLPLCAHHDSGGGVVALDGTTTETAKKTYDALSAEGYRVLAVAYAKVNEKSRYTKDDEQGMVLAGFVAFSDPVLAGAAQALDALKSDGVAVKILTGDSDLVAKHVCEQVGLDGSGIVTGESLERIGDAAIGAIAEKTTVFARVSPAQKHRIIAALRRRGRVVGYMGDGINDAPSLHAADVGISVPAAVDVARDAADIILVEPGLDVLHRGILEGRKASGNAMKYLLMATSSNFGNMVSMAAASVFLPFLPMLATQILLNNFLYDLSQITIPTDNVDDVYIRKPQRWDMRLVRNFMLFIGPISSIFDFATFFVLLSVFHAAQPEFHTGWFVESLATQTLVLFVIRTMGNPFKSRPSPALTATTLAIVAIGILLPFTPAAGPLGFTKLPASYYLFLAAATVTYLFMVEMGKRLIVLRGI